VGAVVLKLTHNPTETIKTKNMKTKSLFLLLLLVVASCSNDDPQPDPSGTVRFTSRIATLDDVQNRAANDQWASSDQIGIYMKAVGEALADASIAEDAANRAYKAASTAADAEFKPASDDQTIYYPMDETQKVDFIAYYPYTNTGITNYTYSVDVSGQSSQAAIDLLYSNNVTGKGKTDTDAAALAFDHKLSKVILNIERGDGTTNDDLSVMTVVFKNMNTQATMALTDGTLTVTSGQTAKDITLLTTTAGTQYEAIMLPEDLNGTKVEFRLNNTPGEVFVWTVGSDTDDPGVFEAGTKYTYTITLARTKVTASASIGQWLEAPSGLNGIAN